MSTLDEFPIPERGKAAWPTHKAKEQAFYTASLAHTDPNSPFKDPNASAEDNVASLENTYDVTRVSLEQDGHSPDMDSLARHYNTQEDRHTQQILTDYISDPTISKDAKKVVLSNYQTTKQLPNSLKQIYLRKAATEDHSTTVADKSSHELMLESFHARLSAQHKMEIELNNFAQGLNPNGDTLQAIGSFVGDVAKNMFVPGALAGSNIYVAGDAFGDRNKVKDFILAGNTASEIGKKWDAMNPEQQMEAWNQFQGRLQSLYGTDYSKYDVMTNITNNHDMPTWHRYLENFVGILDVVGLGRAALAPKEAIKRIIQILTPNVKSMSFFGINSADKVAKTGAAVTELEQKLSKQQEKMVYTYTPKPNPASIMSVVGKVNPIKGSKARMEALLDDTGKIADIMGTNKGEILGEQLPQWTKALDDINPDLAEKIRANDRYFSETLAENTLDPNFVEVSKRGIDREKIYRTFKEAKGAQYQQSNSTMVDDLTSIHGTAVYGRNAENGFDTAEEAIRKMENLKATLPIEDVGNIYTRNINGQHYIYADYSRNYNPFDEFAMGSQTVNAKIYPIPFSDVAINMDGFAKTFLGRHIFPSTTMMDTWIPKAAASTSMRSTKVESDFVRIIKDDILSVKFKEELGKELRLVQENQTWKSYKDLSTSNSHLTKPQTDELYAGYVNYRRLTDYQYEWANLADYKIRHAQDQKAIYTNTGDHLGYGSRVSEDEVSKIKYAWDMDEGKAIKIELPMLNGREVVRLDNPMNKSLDELEDIQGGFQRLSDDNIFEYGIIGGKTKLHSLPQRTLKRIEGYVPRKNKENYYIKKIPRQIRVNGDLISDPKVLEKYARTIGAEWSDVRAQQLAAKFAKEFDGYDIKVAVDRLDSTDGIITDHKVHQEIAEHSRKRGERLPTLDAGVHARLEDPLETMVDLIRNSVRLGIWGDYADVFRKNYTKAFGEFLNRGEFPNVLTDLKAPTIKTKENIEKFKAAQVLFNQFTNQQYKVTLGDDVWKAVFHNIGDVLEKTKIRGVSETARDVARQGNLFTKVPKSITSALFLHLGPLKQWVVQTQQQVEWAVLMPANAIGRMRATGAIGMAILSKASYMKRVASSVYKLAQEASGLDTKEFDAVVNAIHKQGLPQSVDLNMMLHGVVNDVKLSMDASVGRKVAEIPMNVIKTPASFGRAIGYTPAELSNTIGTWLFARDRWLRDNPGKDWNTPETIAKISGDAWDLSGSMATRAGALPYQDGFISTFFQFAAIQQKMLMQLLSGKTLNKTERGKLIAAKATIWGVYGTVLGGVLDKLVAGIDDVEFQSNWNEYKGGLADLVTNNLLTALFREAGEKETSLAISGGMSPLPATHPYVQVVEELMKAIDNDPMSSPRFAFIGSLGSVFQAAKDIKKVFTMLPIDSPDTWMMAAREAAETASGWNNYQKAMLIKEIGDKKDKFGNGMNLELGLVEMGAQLFGFVTRDEQFQYKMTNVKFEESNFVKQHAKEIHDFMKTHRAKYGTEEWNDGLRKYRALATFIPEHLQERVEDEYLALDRKQGISSGDSNTQYILNNIRAITGGKMTEMLGYLKSMNTSESKRVIKELEDSNLIEGNK